MGLTRLITREIVFRKLHFLLGVIGITAAVASLVGEMTLLDKHDWLTAKILAAREAETRQMMAKLEDDIRKITVRMGFNLLILPENQTLADLYDDEKPARYMPEAYADILARSRVATINHVLPTLTRRIKWPEQKRKIILMGVKGEVLIHAAYQKPILESVPAGHLVAGYELHQSLGLVPGQQVQLMGRDFIVSRLMDERGNADDITLWINLAEMQSMLDQPGSINAILALECNCVTDRLSVIRADISQLLPDTRVIEIASQAVARAEARNRTAQQAAASLEQEKNHRWQIRQQQEALGAVLVPLVVVVAGAWIGLLMYFNVRDRRVEIGILRALGLTSRQVLGLFLGKAVLMGLMGALLGQTLGWLVAVGNLAQAEAATIAALFNPRLLVLVLLAAPGLAVVVSWVPALWAARQDPALILQEN